MVGGHTLKTVASISSLVAAIWALNASAQIDNPDMASVINTSGGDKVASWVMDGATKSVSPRARPAPGEYVSGIGVRPYHPDPEARIFYTTDGSTPTLESTEVLPRMRGSLAFYAPIPVFKNTTFKMIAVSKDRDVSDVVSFDYVIATAKPKSVFGSGDYRKLPSAVTLASRTPGAEIYYTLDGSEPSRDSMRYEAPINLSKKRRGVTLKAIAVSANAPDSEVVEYNYSIDKKLPQLKDRASVPAVIAAMSLEEKVSLLTGTATEIGAASATLAIPRLGITSMELADGPAGIRLGGRNATAFPNPMMLAATWNRDIMNEVGAAIGRETKHFGADIILGPGMNIHRDPVAGRVFEYYSEDPFLTGHLAASWIDGTQGVGVGATVKHYAVNQYENNRRTVNVQVSERALREIYLRHFEIATRLANPRGAMAAYNLVNDVHGAENHYLLNEMLRGEFGFDGFVMPDWGAYHDAQSSYMNGLDLNTPGGNLLGGLLGGPDLTVDDVLTGKVSHAAIETALTNVLNTVVATPSFAEGRYDRAEFRELKVLSDELKQRGDELSKRAAAEGMVLLKNANNTLPLAEGISAAVIGAYAEEVYVPGDRVWGAPQMGIIFQGGGSARVGVDPAEVVSLMQGLKNGGFDVKRDESWREGLSADLAKTAASSADVGFVMIGRPGQENTDNTSIDLTAEEIAMIEQSSAAFHAAGKKLVVLLNVAHPVVTSTWEDSVDAILYIGMPGNYGSNIVADILVGRVNPSGKTTDTWVVRHEDHPTYGQAPSQSSVQIEYNEGVFVGYRHFDRHPELVSYPFGYGLSYTSFSYSDMSVSSDSLQALQDGTITVSVVVTNTGDRAGKEIAQFYVAPQGSSVDRPIKELAGFAKTDLLQPGQSQRLSVTLQREDFAYFDEAVGDWVVEPIAYDVIVGGSSDAKVLAEQGVSQRVK